MKLSELNYFELRALSEQQVEAFTAQEYEIYCFLLDDFKGRYSEPEDDYDDESD